MLALEHSGCSLAQNNLPNEQTVPFIFKDTGRPLDSPFPPFTSSPNFLVKVYTCQISGPGPRWKKARVGSHVAGREMELGLGMRGGS